MWGKCGTAKPVALCPHEGPRAASWREIASALAMSLVPDIVDVNPRSDFIRHHVELLAGREPR
jgi:hypothetical protein